MKKLWQKTMRKSVAKSKTQQWETQRKRALGKVKKWILPFTRALKNCIHRLHIKMGETTVIGLEQS